MKKQTTLFIITLMLIMMLTACSSIRFSAEQVSPEPTAEKVPTDPPPGETFKTAEEAVKKIKEVKAAGVEKMSHPGDFELYDIDQIYLLKECPIPGFEQDYIVLVPEGTGIFYKTDASHDKVVFRWHQGWEKEESFPGYTTDGYNLKQYMKTRYYFGERMGDIHIVWWENGDEFNFQYPADTNIAPEDVIEYLEVEQIKL